MKYLIAIILATSCASLEYGMLYTANNAGTYKCTGAAVPKNAITFNNNVTKESEDAFTKATGYSDCTTVSQSEDHQEFLCKKPYLYKHINTSNMAKCHKFLKDNDIKL